jgi:hypothetical protein
VRARRWHAAIESAANVRGARVRPRAPRCAARAPVSRSFARVSLGKHTRKERKSRLKPRDLQISENGGAAELRGQVAPRGVADARSWIPPARGAGVRMR